MLLDALRADRLGVSGYPRSTSPALDTLAARSLVLRQHFALDSHTRASLPQTLFSRTFTPSIFPDNDRVPLEEPWNLFQSLDPAAISLPRALAAQGFTTHAISAHAWLRRDSAFAAEFGSLQRLMDEVAVNPRLGYPSGEQVTDAALTWLDAHAEEDLFLYLHYMDTHFPHRWSADSERLAGPGFDARQVASQFTRDGRPLDTSRLPDPEERRYLDALYDGSVAVVDRAVGRLFQVLERRGWLEDSLILVTSDHGEHLLEQPGRFEHGGAWLETVARVPAILFAPRRLPATTITTATSSLDLAPTVLGILDLPLPPHRSFEGRDLSVWVREGVPAEAADTPVLSPQGLRTPRSTMLVSADGWPRSRDLLADPVPPRGADVDGRLYDRDRDPGETVDLWRDPAAPVQDLLDAWHAALRPAFLRHARARRQGPPPGPFAIASRHLQVTGGGSIERVRTPTLDQLDGAWYRNDDWNLYWIGAAAGAEPIDLSVELPDGAYDLRAAVAGRCLLSAGEGAAQRLDGPPPGERLPWRSAPVQATAVSEVGTLTVHRRNARFRLQPAEQGPPCLLRYLGFTPAGTGTQDDGDATTDRLRALGYVD